MEDRPHLLEEAKPRQNFHVIPRFPLKYCSSPYAILHTDSFIRINFTKRTSIPQKDLYTRIVIIVIYNTI